MNYSEYNLVPTTELFGKIQENLSSYSANGLLDTGRFYSEISLIINKLGIAAYTMKDAIVKLDNFKTELPCDFFLLIPLYLLACYFLTSYCLFQFPPPVLQTRVMCCKSHCVYQSKLV